MLRPRDVASSLALALLLAAAISAQQAARPPQVRIEAPAGDALVSGPTLLRVEVEPVSGVAGVTFFVDGRQVCTIAAPPLQCEWDAGREVEAHQIRAVVNLVEGGRVVRTVRTKGLQFAERVDVDAVQVTVTITDGPGGEFVKGVPRSAFRVLEDGRPQSISHFASSDVPLELIVAIDISGSMTASMGPLKAAVKEFLAAVPARHAVTLLGFNDTAFALTRKTTNPVERVRAVDRLAAWGATALYDVIVRGVDMLGREAGRKALVVFTDGEDQGSHVTLEGVERRLEASDVTLYMIGQGRGVTEDHLKGVMGRLAARTGGRVFSTDDVGALNGAFRALLEELSNQYLLGYQPTNAARDDSWREIRVEVEGHPYVRARQGYRAVPSRR
jgi:VWFA-related protein